MLASWAGEGGRRAKPATELDWIGLNHRLFFLPRFFLFFDEELHVPCCFAGAGEGEMMADEDGDTDEKDVCVEIGDGSDK